MKNGTEVLARPMGAGRARVEHVILAQANASERRDGRTVPVGWYGALECGCDEMPWRPVQCPQTFIEVWVDGERRVWTTSEIRAALHMSGRGFDFDRDRATLIDAVAEGVERVGADAVEEFAAQASRLDGGFVRGQVSVGVMRREERRLWGSSERPGTLAMVACQVVEELRDRARAVCGERGCPPGRWPNVRHAFRTLGVV